MNNVSGVEKDQEIPGNADKAARSSTREAGTKSRLPAWMTDIRQDLGIYFRTLLFANTAFGIIIGITMHLFGLPRAWVLGILAGTLNFVPYFGGLITAAIVGVVSFFAMDAWEKALFPPLVYLILNLVESQLVEVFVMGKRLRLNPLWVFLAILAGGWLFGLVGTLVAIPALIVFNIFFRHSRKWRNRIGQK